MSEPDQNNKAKAQLPKAVDESAANDTPSDGRRPQEIGGRGGLDPTRYGDWEKAGRCIDF